MKIFEKEQMLIQEGRDEMRAEAELQRQRAETAQKQAEALEAENRKLREELARLMQK